jgi:hypothetical protein
VGFLFSEADELGFPERDLVRVEREQGFAGAILEGRDDLGHGVEHAFGHWSWHGGDDGAGYFHDGFGGNGWVLEREMDRHVDIGGCLHGGRVSPVALGVSCGRVCRMQSFPK